VIAVLRELRGAQRQFNKPGARASLRAWFDRWPGPHVARPITGTAAIVESGDTVRATGHCGPVPGAPVEARLDALERQVQKFHADIAEASAQIDGERAARTAGIRNE